MITLALALSALVAAAEPAAVAAPPPASAPAPESGAPPRAAEPEPEPDPSAPRAYVVERVRIVGLLKSERDAVRRHLLVRPKEILDDRNIMLSRLRLLQLGWFSQVEVRVERGSARGLVEVVFTVVERNTVLVTDLVIGTTDPQPLFGGMGINDQNFLGRGFSLGGSFVYGGAPVDRPLTPDRFALRGAFFAPDISIRGVGRFVASANAWAVRGEEFACVDPACAPWDDHFDDAPRVTYRRAGGDLSGGLRTGPFDRVLLGWRYDRIQAEAVAAAGSTEYVPPAVLFGRSTVSALLLSWEHDTRNDFFMPREGIRISAQWVYASRLFGSDYEFSRYWLHGESAFAVAGLPLRLQLQAGAVQGDAPFFDRFYAADLSYFAVGPALGRSLELNFSTDSRYDAVVASAGLEWAFPLARVRGRFFQRAYLAVGARLVGSAAAPGAGRTSISTLPFSADLALRFDTPVGAFNASLGYLVDNFL